MYIMKRRNRILHAVGLGLPLYFLLAAQCGAFEGRAASRNGNIVVTYKVVDGYKISIKIDTKMRKIAYSESLEADVYDIKVDFVDFNNDRYEDVLIKYADETGYSPVVLVNQKNATFINAMRNLKEQIYVNTELSIEEDGDAVRRKDYRLKDMTGDGIPELVFYEAFIGKYGYHSISLRFDSKTTSYLLHQKGKQLKE